MRRNSKNTDYTRLKELLFNGRWEEANKFTIEALLAISNKNSEELSAEDIEAIPFETLNTIDQLWKEYSNGRFGFSIQASILRNIVGIKNLDSDEAINTYINFCQHVGWWANGSQVWKEGLNFTNSALDGHLPAWFIACDGDERYGWVTDVAILCYLESKFNQANKKYLLLDLDGTLVKTADESFKSMKDGQIETDLSKIKIFDKTIDFLSKAKKLDFECIIISDSHPRYVNSILKGFFADYCSDALCLADKPNTLKTLTFLEKKGISISQQTCYMIGDSWLDIELGRGLSIPTILTEFYNAKQLEVRDGIGDYTKNIKSSPTYFVNNYDEILNILENPLQKLLCLEAAFRNAKSDIIRKPRLDSIENNYSNFHRVLARQSQGECDQYYVTQKYFEFSRIDRSAELMGTFRDAVITYIERVLKPKSYSWDIFTYIPDKKTTQPPNKMKELFELIVEEIYQKKWSLNCLDIFEWNEEVDSSTRKQPTIAERRTFVNTNLKLCDIVDVTDKNVIVLDDQYTTGATADAITGKLREKGAKNILFIALFHLVTSVNSSKVCPRCFANGLSKQLQVKINRSTGEKFYSCVLPKYGGDGCGYTENI